MHPFVRAHHAYAEDGQARRGKAREIALCCSCLSLIYIIYLTCIFYAASFFIALMSSLASFRPPRIPRGCSSNLLFARSPSSVILPVFMRQASAQPRSFAESELIVNARVRVCIVHACKPANAI